MSILRVARGGPLLVLLAIGAGCARPDNAQHAAPLRELLQGTPAWVQHDAVGQKLWQAERTFYGAREYLPAWIDGDRMTPQMKDLLPTLQLSEQQGLDPRRYAVDEFARNVAASTSRMRGTRFDAARVPELDARLTYAYLRYAADLLGWTTSPRDVSPNWLVQRHDEDLAARLATAVKTTDVRATLEELAPSHPQYEGLKAALAAERSNPTGHEAQIRMNLERWRWMPRDLGERYILINVPAYQLQVMEGRNPVLAMRVIVGEPDNPTPLFSDLMTYVVFSPYWNIPESIIRAETLPKIAKDPEYLTRNHIEIVGGGRNPRTIDPRSIDWSDESKISALHFRQAPGPENALGLVKFIFPNHFNVYLHDTPMDALFKQENRALSHGCIRVENPLALARYVLRARPEWTDERIAAAMHAKEEDTVTLKHPLPVHIGYWTAWVGPDGRTVTYTADPYGFDEAQRRKSTN